MHTMRHSGFNDLFLEIILGTCYYVRSLAWTFVLDISYCSYHMAHKWNIYLVTGLKWGTLKFIFQK